MRLDLVFVSVCMALIAGSAGAVAYSAFGFGAAGAMLTAIAVLALLSLYNLLSMRVAGRAPGRSAPGNAPGNASRDASGCGAPGHPGRARPRGTRTPGRRHDRAHAG